jgi:BirA family transcriptional regulator, biotin operon repressor / biotin---[acetyl-CoA-carboxylase] ligase
VRVALPTGGSLTGQAVGVDDSGRLEVDDGSGVRVLGAGDVVHVRPV